MKEQLIKLKELNEELIKERKLFEDMVPSFNREIEMNSEYKSELLMEPYQEAKTLYAAYKDEFDKHRALRKEHPRYGEKRVRKELINIFDEEWQSLSCTAPYPSELIEERILEIVDKYLLYDRCGFFDVLDHEIKIANLELLIMNTKDKLFDSSKETVSNIGKGAINIFKPYGEVAKGQFDEATKMTKGLINKGSKKLVKLLQKIEDKTSE